MTEPWLAPPAPRPPPPPVVGARQLLGASFELLLGSGEQMRRASFYIGAIVLGTLGPLALAMWGSVVIGIRLDPVDPTSFGGPAAGWLTVLVLVAIPGLAVASIEGSAIAIALLGGRWAGRPITVRQALARSRAVYWSLVGASIIVAIPVNVVQGVIDLTLGPESPAALPVSFVTGVAIQAPFIYVGSGIVLGGVGAVEAVRRSIRVFAVRKRAALLVAILPTVFGLILLLALAAGADIVLRVVGAFGIGPDSGPAGLALGTMLVVAGVFAAGTLLFTAGAIIHAPQVVMFVSLTHATIGLDSVAPAVADPDRPDARRRGVPWFGRPMLAGFVLGAVGLAAFLATS